MLLEETFHLSQSICSKPECIIVSNRGPIELSLGPNGKHIIKNSSGGVVTGLLGAIQQHSAVWIALTTVENNHQASHTDCFVPLPPATPLSDVTPRFVVIPQQMYHRYYDCISNKVLWFAQHSLLQPIEGTTFDQSTRYDWEQGYSAVNDAVARAVIEELSLRGTGIPVLFQDYHLYLVAEQVRAHFPKARLSHFIHIPWPDARYMAILPDYMIQAIYRSMVTNDIIGFQTLNDAQNFLVGAERFLKNTQVLLNTNNPVGTLLWQNRRVQIRLYPMAVSPDYIQTIAKSKEAKAAIEALNPLIRFNNKQQIILRVDRVEPTKNIIRGFQAYELLLQTHPELHGKIAFLALLVPSRQNLIEYRSYELHIRNIINNINSQYGWKQWQPIIAIFDNDRIRALACLQYFDVLLVNPVIDGMNLVVKEGGVVNQRDGVIVLSCTAGAHDILGKHVLSVTPTDIEATANALYQGLTMSVEERISRACQVRQILLAEDASQDLKKQIDELHQIKSLNNVL